MTISPSSNKIHIFLSYAHKDQNYIQELKKYLNVLVRRLEVSIGPPDPGAPGMDRDKEIEEYLNMANLILVFLSADYIASDRQYNEMLRAMKRHDEDFVRVVPIILQPCDWSSTPLAQFQALPVNGRAVTTFSNRDKAFVDIMSGIRIVVDQIQRDIIPNSEQSKLLSPDESFTPPNRNRTIPTIIRQGKFEKEAITKNITADIPIQDIYDDQLGFTIYALAFGEFIASQETSTPLTIGIHGSWGSGKSSLMRLIQKQLDRPLTFREQWLWITWLFFFFSTLPIWLSGHLVLWIGDRLKLKYTWLKALSKDLVYDPDNSIPYAQNSRQTGQQPLHFWQRIEKWHKPRNPLTHPTVWFNAWKFDQEEQLWAALALEVLNQIQKKYHFFERSLFGLRLALKRFSVVNFIKAVALPLLFGCIYWVYMSYTKVLPTIFLPLFGHQIALGQFVLWAGIIISAWIPIINIAKDPFQINVKSAFDKPNYKDKVGFIGSFADDFSQIVALITRPRLGWKSRKLVIFIDDLDRCQAPKAADIVEAINLFLDSQGCTFVLGMDITPVAANIETKYQEIFDKMRRDDINMISPGRSFLDKIIQVPFQIPPSTKGEMVQLVRSIAHPDLIRYKQDIANHKLVLPTGNQNNQDQIQMKGTSRQTLTSPLIANTIQPDPASYKLDDVRAAMEEGIHYLPENPRQIKRFINLFRLYIYIVSARRLLQSKEDTTGKPQLRVSLSHLAVWVAWSMRWPAIAKSLQEEAQFSREELREYLTNISSQLDNDGMWAFLKHANDWSAYNGCVNTVTLRMNQEKNAPSDWCHLPWYQWLRQKDFLKCIKQMESFWLVPAGANEDDLHIMLTLNRATFATDTDITTINNDIPDV